MKSKFSIVALTITAYGLLITLAGCHPEKKPGMFSLLPPAQSGIDFRNDIYDNDSSYSFINEFGYMGGGVGIGDFNNDGLKDIFFTGNQVSCRLYINKGGNRFEDISQKAGIRTDVWCSGVSIADVNNDGYDDIYVCVFGKDLMHHTANLLFINQHDLTFKEEAAAYGLADSGNSTQAVFFDYDKDGDLDMYLNNYLLSENNANTVFPRDRTGNSPANDRLYRNDGNRNGEGHPVFTDVTLQAGIKEDGYGLGISVSDFNNDNWPDIYIANDFITNDELWLNNRNGTFTNVISRALRHQSYSSMGCDAADINNDAKPDILSLDMLPGTNERRKTSFSVMNYDRYESERAMGYEPEFMRNMLQLNMGSYREGDTTMPFFSEIGQLAGIQATDWSWSVLMADFNNDGWKDIHITNGIGRDFINGDFLAYSSGIFSSDMSREEQETEIRKRLAELDHVNLSDYLYLNNHNYTFTDASAASGVDIPAMSNGAAYADLDNDGDLDLVTNNISSDAFIFINNTVQKTKPIQEHYLRVQLAGDSLNTKGFGTKLFVYQDGHVQFQEQNPVRGYFSSVDQELLFGLGTAAKADSLTVIWPDNRRQVLRNIAADTSLVISWKEAISVKELPAAPPSFLFTDITSASGIRYKHTDVPFNDYNEQRLLPQKFSQLGPFIATGDVNNDGRIDFFTGGGFNSHGEVFIQKEGASFTGMPLPDSIKWEEDMDCVFFDADRDGDEDLLVTSGDTRYPENSPHYKPRLYINDGKGNFSRDPAAMPDSVTTIAGCVTAGDYDGDGDLDLFIGGRVSRSYPASPRSFILRNDGGRFTDVTLQVCPALQRAGMVTAASWADLDNDRQPDLILTGEWMPVRIFKNKGGHLTETTGETGLTHNNGMWRSLVVTDLDKDGDLDIVAGNIGLNCDFHPSPAEPMDLYAADLDHNGSLDPVLFYYLPDKNGIKHSYPAAGLTQLASQVPAVKKKYLLFKDYARADYADLFGSVPASEMLHFSCEETRSCYFENTGNGKFVKHVLPAEAQFAPVNAILCEDMDGDGIKDILLAGNEYQTDVMTGRYDASYGCFLRGNRDKTYFAVPPAESGFRLHGDVKDLAMLHLPGNTRIVLAAVNNDVLQAFRIGK